MNGNSTAVAIADARMNLLLLREEGWLSEAETAVISRGIAAIEYLTELDELPASVYAARQC